MSGEELKAAQKHRAEESKKKRANNRVTSAGLLESRNIPFYTNNSGVHLIVDGGAAGTIDFWPGTGKWKARSGKDGAGVMNLLEFIRVSAWKDKKHNESKSIPDDVMEELNFMSRKRG